MTTYSPELGSSESDDDATDSRCPKCGRWQPDLDGFGVLKCIHCDYCQHPSSSGTPLVCGMCGKEVRP